MRRLLAGLMLLTAACASSAGDTSGEEGVSEDQLISDSCSSSPNNPSWMQTEVKSFDDLKVRIGTMGTGEKGDVLFFHGFADRFDNHRPLFERFVSAGLRVIAFDYPSHGETCGRSLDRFDFTSLAELAGKVESLKAQKSAPLYISGWSTGGLLAVRMAQGLKDDTLSRPISGMALFAPGVDVKTVVKVKEETLTRNDSAPHAAGPKPASPMLRPLFAAALLLNSHKSSEQMPKIPTLVITGGEDTDQYVNTAGVESWTKTQRANGALTTGLSCAGGFHELDNEPEPMGGSVRDAAATFLASKGATKPAASSACKPY